MAIIKKSDLAPGAAFGKNLSESEKRKKMLASIPAKYQKFLPPSQQTIGPKYQPPKSSVSKASPTVSAPSRPPMDSKGNPKTGGPIFGGPLGRAIANTNLGSLKGAVTRANAARRGQPVSQAPVKTASRVNTIAPLKPVNIVPNYRKPATKEAPVARPVTKVAARPATPVASAAALLGESFKSVPKTSAPVARTASPVAKAPATRSMEPMKPMASLSVSASETQPMGKREVDLSISTKKGNLFQRLGERIKQRQLARADRKAAGSPMKSTTSVPSTPTPSAPQAESGQGLSTVGKAMLSNYLSRKKYMGGGKMEYGMGGKMKSYAKGGMIEKEGMKPKKKTAMDGLKALGKYVSTFGLATEGYNPAEGRYPKKKVEVKNQESLKKYKYGGKMDKKKAFLEMIAKLKTKKK